MTPAIEIRVENERGCGFRQPGGTYLVSDGLAMPCGKLPLLLDVCPVCRAGIKPSRGWTWLNIDALSRGCPNSCKATYCSECPVNGSLGVPCGLLWVGEKFYPSPADFTSEAAKMGVSRRIASIPHDFELGVTWVLFAHRKAIKKPCDLSDAHADDCECEGTGLLYQAAIFHAFRPSRIEYVVTGKESDDELLRLANRGVTLVKVVPNKTPLFTEEIASEVLK